MRGSNWNALKRRVDSFKGILYKDEFTVYDFDSDYRNATGAIFVLREYGAIEDTGKTEESVTDTNSQVVKVWKWVDYQEDLQDRYEERDELPCGHRLHIHNPPNSEPDQFGCKFCDGRVIFSEETIRELM